MVEKLSIRVRNLPESGFSCLPYACSFRAQDDRKSDLLNLEKLGCPTDKFLYIYKAYDSCITQAYNPLRRR